LGAKDSNGGSILLATSPNKHGSMLHASVRVLTKKIEIVAQQIEQAKTWKKGLLQQIFV
jgi:type I restriction enzyme S subunit